MRYKVKVKVTKEYELKVYACDREEAGKKAIGLVKSYNYTPLNPSFEIQSAKGDPE